MRFADEEMAVKTWLKAHPLLTPLVAGRVFFGVPEGSPAMPLVTVALLAGSLAAPVAHSRLTFDCWAKTKQDAVQLRNALLAALCDLSGDLLDGDTFCYNTYDHVVTWVPDDEAKLARYVVDATFSVRPV